MASLLEWESVKTVLWWLHGHSAHWYHSGSMHRLWRPSWSLSVVARLYQAWSVVPSLCPSREAVTDSVHSEWAVRGQWLPWPRWTSSRHQSQCQCETWRQTHRLDRRSFSDMTPQQPSLPSSSSPSSPCSSVSPWTVWMSRNWSLLLLLMTTSLIPKLPVSEHLCEM